jgi:hypothetical protein
LTHVTGIFQKSAFTKTTRTARREDRAWLFVAVTQAAPGIFSFESRKGYAVQLGKGTLKSGRALAQARKAESQRMTPTQMQTVGC